MVNQPIELKDVTPAALKAADIEVSEVVEGQTLCNLITDPDRRDWGSVYNGERGPHHNNTKMPLYLVGEEQKYVWYPVTGDGLVVDLGADPYEEENLADDFEHTTDLQQWRGRLVERLTGRLEGFSIDGEIRTVTPESCYRRCYS